MLCPLTCKTQAVLPDLSFYCLCAFRSLIIHSLLCCNRFWNLTYWSRVTLSNYCTYINCCWACRVTFDGKMILYPTRGAPAVLNRGCFWQSSLAREVWCCIIANAIELHRIRAGPLRKLEAAEISPQRSKHVFSIFYNGLHFQIRQKSLSVNMRLMIFWNCLKMAGCFSCSV